jgi:DNA-binding response OmpR family regulator
MREPTPMPPPVLICDADPERRAHLIDNLTADGLTVSAASRIEDARSKLAACGPRALVLGPLAASADAMMLLRELRAEQPPMSVEPALPVLCLGRGGDELAELRALRAGADDWLALPLRYPVLHARLLALLRRCEERARLGTVRIGRLELNNAQRSVRVDGRPVSLSKQEFGLLCRLAADPTRVFTKTELLRDVWGYPENARSRTIDSHACRLRRKLATPDGPSYVDNVWGVGYRLLSPVEAPERNGSAA